MKIVYDVEASRGIEIANRDVRGSELSNAAKYIQQDTCQGYDTPQ